MKTPIYLKREEITDVHATLLDMLNKLRANEQAGEDCNQVVMQLLPDKDGIEWKMFVYYDNKKQSFYFSYQDQDGDDTLFTHDYDLYAVMAQMVAEIIAVKDFEWIELD